MQYNLCNEPWLKYAIGAVADRGLKASQWTSARLSSDVLFVETHRCVEYLTLTPGLKPCYPCFSRRAAVLATTITAGVAWQRLASGLQRITSHSQPQPINGFHCVG